jgi:hypothetical protein
MARLLPLLLLVLSACRSGKTELEAGAILLEIKCAEPGQTPDELRVWVYDGTGRLWDGTRVPADGKLSPKSAQDLGSLLIQPGTLTGKLRVHVQGLARGVRILDGTLMAAPTEANRTFDVVLQSAIPADGDGDGVPDVIDDCAGFANPQQGGCPAGNDASVPSPDAPVDSPRPANDGPSDTVRAPDGTDGANDPSFSDDALIPDDATTVRRDVAADFVDTAVLTKSDVAQDWPADNRPNPDVTESRPETPADPDVGPDLGKGDTSDTAGDRADVRADVVVLPEVGPDRGADSPAGTPDVDEGCGDLGRCNLSQGALCTSGAECASGICADGVCCTSTCEGPCRSCNQPSTMGTCQAYAAGKNPESECANGATCNGAGACGAPPPPNLANGQLCSSDTQCASGFCVDGACCNSRCDQPCYACQSGRCLTVHNTEDIPQCSGGHTCDKKGSCI